MATYLLSWDPNKWDWRNLKEQSESVSKGSPVTRPWSCGDARRIFVGDRVFLIRQGKEPRGIFATGVVDRGSYEASRVDAQDAVSGKNSLVIDVKFEMLLDGTNEVGIARSELGKGPFKKFLWDIKKSGVKIPDDVASALEKAWDEKVGLSPAKAKEREEEERKAREEEERRAKAEAARKAKEAAAKKAKLEAARRAKEEREKREREAESRKRQEAARQEAARQEAEEIKRLEAEKSRLEKERLAQLQQIKEREEKERLAREKSAQEKEAVLSAVQKKPVASKEEILRSIVEDYFEMLKADANGELYSKADHRNRLQTDLGLDNDDLIDETCRKISAVLLEIGLPTVEGYLPDGNVPAELETIVHVYIEGAPEAVEALWIDKDPSTVSIPVELDDSRALWVATPAPSGFKPDSDNLWVPGIPLEVDFREREQRNHDLQIAGERFVMAFERARLREAGRKDLIEQLGWVTQTHGYDLGYHVRSFEEDGSDRLIVVKTTNYGARFPFSLSRTELACAKSNGDRFYIYRVFGFSRGAKLYILEDLMKFESDLEPVAYRLTI